MGGGKFHICLKTYFNESNLFYKLLCPIYLYIRQKCQHLHIFRISDDRSKKVPFIVNFRNCNLDLHRKLDTIKIIILV